MDVVLSVLNDNYIVSVCVCVGGEVEQLCRVCEGVRLVVDICKLCLIGVGFFFFFLEGCLIVWVSAQTYVTQTKNNTINARPR